MTNYIVTCANKIMLVFGRLVGNVTALITSTGQLNGQMGDANIRQVFTEHFKSPYQPNKSDSDLGFAEKFEQLQNSLPVGPIPFIDISTSNACISSLKHRKTPGHDGISNEHIIYSSTDLLVHHSLLFNVSHGMVLFLMITASASYYLC